MASANFLVSNQPQRHLCEKDSIDTQKTDERQQNCKSKSSSSDTLTQDLSSSSTLTKASSSSPSSISTLPASLVAENIPQPQSPNYSREQPLRENNPKPFSFLEHKQIHQIRNDRDAFVVAISGPSSAGKSTLAILLHEIFKGGNSENEVPNIITQDSYFIDKAYCPRTSFISTPNKTEKDFICTTINKGAAPVYCTFRYFSSSNHLNHDRFRISCPNTDVDGAIDFKSLSHDLENLISKGWLPESEKRVDPIVVSRLAQEYEQLIQKMKKRVEKFAWKMVSLNAKHKYRGYLFVDSRVEDHQVSDADIPYIMKDREVGRLFTHRIIFVEGFLLYPQPSSSKNGPNNHNMENYNKKAGILVSGESLCGCGEGKTVIPAQSDFEIANLLEKEGLQKYFNVKLFLEESKAEVKARRFNRPEYIDNHISGRGRPLGKMWRCEGYFDDVAWKEYELVHRWLLNGGRPVPAEEGESILEPLGGDTPLELNTQSPIIVRSEKSKNDGEGGVEGAVIWGVDMILSEMEKVEDARRQYWLDYGYN